MFLIVNKFKVKWICGIVKKKKEHFLNKVKQIYSLDKRELARSFENEVMDSEYIITHIKHECLVLGFSWTKSEQKSIQITALQL